MPPPRMPSPVFTTLKKWLCCDSFDETDTQNEPQNRTTERTPLLASEQRNYVSPLYGKGIAYMLRRKLAGLGGNNPPPSLRVDENNATLLEFNVLYNALKRNHDENFLLGRQTANGIELYLGDNSVANERNVSQLVLQGLQIIIRNSLREFGSDSPQNEALKELENILAEIDIKLRAFDMEDAGMTENVSKEYVDALLDSLNTLGPKIHAANAKRIPPSLAPRDVPPMATDCMMHWICALEDAKTEIDLTRKVQKLIKNMQQEAQDKFLAHRLSFEECKNYFEKMRTQFAWEGLKALSDLASALKNNIPDQNIEAQYYPALHDNLYGRVLEDQIAKMLLEHPSEHTLNGMQEFAKFILNILKEMTWPEQETAVMEIVEELRSEEKGGHFRLGISDKLRKILDAEGADQIHAALCEFLSCKPSTGHDCVEGAMIAWAIEGSDTFCLHPVVEKWQEDSFDFYEEDIQPRKTHTTKENPQASSSKAGLTLPHQQSSLNPAASHPLHRTEKSKPTISDPGETLRTMLRHGEPYIAGPSGHIITSLYMGHDMIRRKRFVNLAALLAGYAPGFIYGGGHSLRELLDTANKLDEHLHSPSPLFSRNENRAEFVSDYGNFLAQVYQDDMEDGKKKIDIVKEKIWKNMISYYRENSYYGTPEGKAALVVKSKIDAVDY